MLQEDAGAAAASEQVEIAELLGDLEAKEEELAESASANVTTQSLVQSALARLKDGDREGVGGETDEESAARGHGTSTAAVIASQGGLDEPSASLSAAPIQDLGTVGRGTKRLVLQPAQVLLGLCRCQAPCLVGLRAQECCCNVGAGRGWPLDMCRGHPITAMSGWHTA